MATKPKPATKGKAAATRTGATTQRRKQMFLEAFANSGNIGVSADAVGIHRSTHFQWMEVDADYADAFVTAKAKAVDVLRREVWRRGVEGWEEPVYQGGKLVGVVRRFDSKLLMFELEHFDPDRYGRRVTVLTEDVVDAECRRLAADLERRRAATGQAAKAPSPSS